MKPVLRPLLRGVLTSLLLIVALGSSLASLTLAGPSSSECQELCDWAAQVCTGDQGCMEDCLGSSTAEIDDARSRCLGDTPSTCKSANCCLKFTYDAEYWQQNCYGN
ncbi:MAG: hypothetical protein ABIJ09_22090 [Pseudomonadota bacterium]